MHAIEALLQRSSAPRLVEPAPQGEQREQIFRAALRAPDHARLRPWRFLVVEGAGRERLGEAMQRAMRAHTPQLSPQEADKLRSNPLRAPLIVVLVASLSDHPKVPEIEQLLSVACAAQNMLLAAHALGFGGIWRTGPVTYTRELRAELGLAATERLLGFLYLGTPGNAARAVAEVAVAEHFRAWPGAGVFRED